MPRYFRVVLGRASAYVEDCLAGGFIGADFDVDEDLTGRLPENWRDFNAEFIPVVMARNPEKTKIGAGLACGMLWTVSKGIEVGDVILSPSGDRSYHVGTVVSGYEYVAGGPLQHRRRVEWTRGIIQRDDMSEELQRSAGSIGTVAEVTKYAAEIDRLLSGAPEPELAAADPSVEDPSVFALERHLEDFLVANWSQTPLGQQYLIYEDEGKAIGQQYPTDTGPLDILAVSKDGTELLVIELKRGRASDVVVGQIQRYMGYVQEELAEPNQKVRGVIIALEDDLRLRRALSVTNNIDFYRYEVRFNLIKG